MQSSCAQRPCELSKASGVVFLTLSNLTKFQHTDFKALTHIFSIPACHMGRNNVPTNTMTGDEADVLLVAFHPFQRFFSNLKKTPKMLNRNLLQNGNMFAVRSSCSEIPNNCNFLQFNTLHGATPPVQWCSPDWMMMPLTMTIIPYTIGVNAPNFTKFSKVPTC